MDARGQILGVLLLALAAFLLIDGLSHEPPPIPGTTVQQHAHSAAQTKDDGSTDGGSSDQPLTAVPTHPAIIEQKGRGQHAEERADESSEYWSILGRRLKITDTLLAIFTFCLIVVGGWQARRLRQTVQKMDEVAVGQTADMAKSIAEGAKAAAAMANVAESLATSTAAQLIMRDQIPKQMRAYITIERAQFFGQNAATHFKFQCDLSITNSGHTPAHRVFIQIRCKVLPFPLADDFDLTIQKPVIGEGGLINPQRPFFSSAIAEDIYPEETVWRTIINGPVDGAPDQKVFVWGTVWYEDAFGEPHQTNFCQFVLWQLPGIFNTINATRHNNGN